MDGYRYLGHSQFEKVRKGMVIDDKQAYIGTFSDILYDGDIQKETLTYGEFQDMRGRLNIGNIFWVELDEIWFKENAFDIDDNGSISLDRHVGRSDLSPLFTCNYLSLKNKCEKAYWDDDLLSDYLGSFV